MSCARALAVLGLPARLADVQAAEVLFLIEEQGVINLLINKGFLAGLTAMRARLNIPFVHETNR